MLKLIQVIHLVTPDTSCFHQPIKPMRFLLSKTVFVVFNIVNSLIYTKAHTYNDQTINTKLEIVVNIEMIKDYMEKKVLNHFETILRLLVLGYWSINSKSSTKLGTRLRAQLQ